MTSAQLLAAAQFVADRWPDATISRNSQGNLAWTTPGAIPDWFAWLDLSTGEVHYRDSDGAWLVQPPT